MKDIFSLVKTSNKITKAARPAKPSVRAAAALSPENTRVVAPMAAFAKNWQTAGSYLIKNIPSGALSALEDAQKVKVAAFDLDGTLINTKTGGSFARGSSDWQLWKNKAQKESAVIDKLRDMVEKKYIVVIFSNQGGIVASPSSKSYENFKTRVNYVVEHIQKEVESFLPLILASPKKPAKVKTHQELFTKMRKPQLGMWEELQKYLGDTKIDLENSFFVGDAAGRDGDFADSDRKFAENARVAFKVPEEFFV